MDEDQAHTVRCTSGQRHGLQRQFPEGSAHEVVWHPAQVRASLCMSQGTGLGLRLLAEHSSAEGDCDHQQRTGTLLHCGTLLAFNGCTSSSSSAKAAGAARRLLSKARARLPARDEPLSTS